MEKMKTKYDFVGSLFRAYADVHYKIGDNAL